MLASASAKIELPSAKLKLAQKWHSAKIYPSAKFNLALTY